MKNEQTPGIHDSGLAGPPTVSGVKSRGFSPLPPPSVWSAVPYPPPPVVGWGLVSISCSMVFLRFPSGADLAKGGEDTTLTVGRGRPETLGTLEGGHHTDGEGGLTPQDPRGKTPH